jgi:hypothetical protein
MSIEVCRQDFVNQFKMEMAALTAEEVAEFESFFAEAVKAKKDDLAKAEEKKAAESTEKKEEKVA